MSDLDTKTGDPIDTAHIRRCLAAGMSEMAGHGQLVPDLLDEIDRLNAELAGLRDLLDGAVLKGQGYCGGRHWNGGTCFHPAGHPVGHPTHFSEDELAKAEHRLSLVQSLLDELTADPDLSMPKRALANDIRALLRGAPHEGEGERA